MITREKIIAYVADTYDVQPEYTFKKFPSYCVFKHPRNHKWFGLMMLIPQNKLYGDSETEIAVIDVKVTPEIGDILKANKAYYPAYHMNKEHWITIDLTTIDDFDQLTDLIDDSFESTK
ncbi:MmcQ/YjbR family DNA-binding protein [Lapidilactobacillus mulanensis]|uniref:MmcQ/YjbR family DNA-binding protein n=1 Tax=Lapidilactobacillus mulanensis TaxID=2485999 RepID=A0ABW4DLS9_9LACO|nr:MmcQ/YjbR family DNA-binding protein [Lapidilactobacillus mulanensis]